MKYSGEFLSGSWQNWYSTYCLFVLFQ